MAACCDNGCSRYEVPKELLLMVEGLLKNEQWQKHLPLEKQDRIFSDASKQGLGAHLNLTKVGGQWTWEEKVKSHINWLELKAAFLALQAFLPQLKYQHVQVGIDNKTAMTYINKLGGTHSHRLTSLALEMWNFATDRSLTLSAVYVPGKEIPDCRQKVKGVPGQPGMDAASSGVSGNTKSSWLL